ncbi:MAG: hypothetical protein ABJF01_18990 [bacterium]
MTRWMSAIALSAALGCAESPAESVRDDAAKIPPEASSPDAFVGAWQSVTPSYDFIRLSVYSKSSEMGVFAARLTLSGVAWEGSGRIDGDSLVANMAVAGGTQFAGRIVMRAHDARTLKMRLAGSPPIDLTLVRED